MDQHSYLITSQLIADCKTGNINSQKIIYDLLSSAMYKLCIDQAPGPAHAEIILVRGFVQLFNSLSYYRSSENFFDWSTSIFLQSIQIYNEQLQQCTSGIIEVKMRKEWQLFKHPAS